MDTFEKMSLLRKRIDQVCYPIGCNFLQKGFKFNIRTGITLILISITTILLARTQYLRFKAGRFLDGCSIFTIYGVLIQAQVKLFISLKGRDLIYKMGCWYCDIHQKHQKDKERYKILKLCYRRCFMIFKSIILIYGLAFLSFMSFPLLAYVFNNGEISMFIELELPAVDPKTYGGYITTMIYQLTIMCYGLMGLLAADINFMIVTTNYTCLAEIFEVSLKEFSEKLDYDGDEKYKNMIRHELRNLIIEHKEIVTFISDHDEMYSNIAFSQIAGSVFMILGGLFVTTFKPWIPGYGLFMAGVFQLLIYCTVGTVIEVWNDRTVNAIYEVPWYKLTKERAMEFLFMYKKAQLLSLLSIAGIAPLSVATAKEVLNKIYSMYMMFMTFIEGKTFE